MHVIRRIPVALLVVVIGCASQAYLDASFHDRATAICRTTLDAKKAQGAFPFPSFNPTRPDRSKLPEIGRFEEATVMIYERWVSEVRALGQPSYPRTQWSEFTSALSRNLDIIREQQRAAASSDTTKFTETYYSGSAAQQRVIIAGRALGLSACAQAASA